MEWESTSDLVSFLREFQKVHSHNSEGHSICVSEYLFCSLVGFIGNLSLLDIFFSAGGTTRRTTQGGEFL